MSTTDLPHRDCYCLAVRRLSRLLTQAYDARLAPVGLKATQFTALVAVDRAGAEGGRISRLAEALDMDASTLSRNLKPLAARGLVALEPGADRRERLARLTDAGRRRLESALPHWRAAQRDAEAAFGAAARDRLTILAGQARRL